VKAIATFSSSRCVLGALMIGLVLGSCGYKGPLYLPPKDKPAATPRIPAAPPETNPDSIPDRRPVPSESVPAPK
jgi:predicted small lipoprotein YifL